MRIHIITDKSSLDDIKSSINGKLTNYLSEYSVNYILKENIKDHCFTNYLLIIEDEDEHYLNIAAAGIEYKHFEDIVICENLISSTCFIDSISNQPIICTVDFKIGDPRKVFDNIQKIYNNIKIKYSSTIVIGHTQFETQTTDDIGDQANKLKELFRKNNDSVLDKAGMSLKTLASIFRDKVDLLRYQKEIELLKNELCVHEDIFNEELKSYIPSEKFNNLSRPIIGKSVAINRIKYFIEKFAKSDCRILIQADSGTGKELAARAIHELSKRNNKPFVAINCGSLNDNLLESELFGHVKGAFNNAIKNRKGRFELADGGTIFLDEIGDVSAAMQVKLLRVIQEGEFQKVGSDITETTNVRVISATNKNLANLVQDKKFREDLYYRLNVVHLTLPLLKDRADDIPLLINYFITKNSAQLNFTKEAIAYLQKLQWTRSNVRELENCFLRSITYFSERANKSIGVDEIAFVIKEINNEIEPSTENKKVSPSDHSSTIIFLDKIENILIAHYQNKPNVTEDDIASKYISTIDGKSRISRVYFSSDELSPHKPNIEKLLDQYPNRWSNARTKCKFIKNAKAPKK